MNARQQKVKDEAERLKIALKWGARIDKLLARKVNPKSQAQFCRDYDITEGHFSRSKNGKAIPSPETVEKVEAGFLAEKV